MLWAQGSTPGACAQGCRNRSYAWAAPHVTARFGRSRSDTDTDTWLAAEHIHKAKFNSLAGVEGQILVVAKVDPILRQCYTHDIIRAMDLIWHQSIVHGNIESFVRGSRDYWVFDSFRRLDILRWVQ